MQPLISVILPVYNVESYLKKCLESVLAQTYKNLEIIIVNDASTDATPQICDEFARADSRIKVIHMSKNEGVSNARNSALDIFKGDYLCFVDGDDFVEPDYIEFLYTLLKEYNCDVSMCGYYNIYDNGSKSEAFPNDLPKQAMTASEALCEIFYNKASSSNCCKLFPRHVFDNLRYKSYALGEDTLVTYNIFCKINNIAYSNAPKYYYFYRTSSATRKKEDFYRFYDYILVAKETESFIPKNDRRLRRAFATRIVEHSFYAYMKLRNLDRDWSEEKKQIVRNIKKYRLTVLADKRAALRTKLACLASFGTMKTVDIIYDHIEKRS